MAEHIYVFCPQCGEEHVHLRVNVPIHCSCGNTITRREQLALRRPYPPALYKC